MTMNLQNNQCLRLLSDRQVAYRLGIATQEFVTLEMDCSHFPRPVELTPEICCWVEQEVDDYIDRLIWRRNQRLEGWEEQQHTLREAAPDAEERLAAANR